MINCNAEFYQGTKGQLFRLTRSPEIVEAHILYIAPLFEQANQTRHMLTRSAINAYHHNVESIIFDHYGCGDSEGDLLDATLMLWQQDIVTQIVEIKKSSSKPVFLSVLLSAGLLLNDDIIALIDGLFVVQPDFNGKSFIRQFKRLAIAGDLIKNTNSNEIKEDIGSNNNEMLRTDHIVDIAGYQLTQSLLDELAKQSLKQLSPKELTCTWFEWLTTDCPLAPSRLKQQQGIQAIFQQTEFIMFDDIKYWQSTSLELSQHFLNAEQQVISKLLESYKLSGQTSC